jgi:hypothetical protein
MLLLAYTTLAGDSDRSRVRPCFRVSSAFESCRVYRRIPADRIWDLGSIQTNYPSALSHFATIAAPRKRDML